MEINIDETLRKIYFDPSGFMSQNNLFKEAKKNKQGHNSENRPRMVRKKR
jgi:hypothetical protein